MKTTIYSMLLVTFIFILLKCPEVYSAPKNQQVSPTQYDTTQYILMMEKILHLQSQLIHAPKNNQLKKSMLSISIDSSRGCFYTVGQGISKPQIADLVMQQRAATLSAQRWVLYLKKWNKGKMIPFGAKISGTVTYDKTVYSRQCGDTLFMMLEIPIGSVN